MITKLVFLVETSQTPGYFAHQYVIRCGMVLSSMKKTLNSNTDLGLSTFLHTRSLFSVSAYTNCLHLLLNPRCVLILFKKD